MNLKGIISGVGFSSAILISSFVLTNCTCKISEEDVAKLQDLRRQEASLNDEITKKRADKVSLERELASREAETKKCKEDQTFVQTKLSEWPNIWPDYQPEKPKPDEAQPAEQKRKPKTK